MADSRKSVQFKSSGKERKVSKKSIAGISAEHGNDSKADKSACRRRKSVASQFAHPISGETVKERQVSLTFTKTDEKSHPSPFYLRALVVENAFLLELFGKGNCSISNYFVKVNLS